MALGLSKLRTVCRLGSANSRQRHSGAERHFLE